MFDFHNVTPLQIYPRYYTTGQGPIPGAEFLWSSRVKIYSLGILLKEAYMSPHYITDQMENSLERKFFTVPFQ